MMALGMLNTVVPLLWHYLRYWWNERNFSSTVITFDRLNTYFCPWMIQQPRQQLSGSPTPKHKILNASNYSIVNDHRPNCQKSQLFTNLLTISVYLILSEIWLCILKLPEFQQFWKTGNFPSHKYPLAYMQSCVQQDGKYYLRKSFDNNS